jgi:hypothetical protein
MKFTNLILLVMFACYSICYSENEVTLYVNQGTGRVYVAPGKGRVLLGKFKPEKDENPKEAKVVIAINKISKIRKSVPSQNWYDKFSIRGYAQLRENILIDKKGADWLHPSDRSVNSDETFLLRRGRIALSSSPTSNVDIFIQPDLSSKPGLGDFSIQLRDLYADYFFDEKKEYRFRFGQTIIPYGFGNLQSSSRRGPLERPEALNSGAEGERDLGIFFMYTPNEIHKRFEFLTKNKLKGSGDYGIFSVGLYNGQGLNRSDRNGEPHILSRITYPFEIADQVFLEPNISGYYGRYVPLTEVTLSETEPLLPANGITDSRLAFGLVLHPAPFGFELEWNSGTGPELSSDFTRITSEKINGGSILFNYMTEVFKKDLIPFIQWQYYKGGRKFAVNAPLVIVNELSFGFEIFQSDYLKYTTQYSYTPRRTNSNEIPYLDLTDGHRLGLQAQVMY